jgi:hypothetical protein
MHRHAEPAHDNDEKDLSRETGADEDFDRRADALKRENAPALRNVGGLRDRLQHF